MDGQGPNQPPGNFEDQFRRMLLSGSTPDNSSPQVRLPPPNYGPNFVQPHPQQYDGSTVYASPATAQYPRPAPPTHQVSHTSVQAQGPNQAPPPHVPPHMRPRGNARSAQNQEVSHHTNTPVPPVQARGGYRGGRTGYSRGDGRGGAAQRQHRQQQIQLDPNAFARGGPVQTQGRTNLFDPNFQAPNHTMMRNDQRERQAQYLKQLVRKEVPPLEMSQSERDQMEDFRSALQKLCHEVCEEHPTLPKVQLECFGSFASGFASAGSDMDLALVVQDQQASTDAVFSMLEDDLPRALEKKLLQAGHGARLLTRTRVPIIKVCESPGLSFLDKLRAERERWESLPNEKKYPHLYPDGDDDLEDAPNMIEGVRVAEKVTPTPATIHEPAYVTVETQKTVTKKATVEDQSTNPPVTISETSVGSEVTTTTKTSEEVKQKREHTNTWTRERKPGPLDFPKDGVGIQCDINFFNPLGLHNTQMLRCYSLCDPRVRPMVLFIKSWAKLRKINSSYSGTLSSYGYVLMVLHYLMNIVQPPVLPNLQAAWRPDQRCTPAGAAKVEVDGWEVDFWRNEDEIINAVQSGQMSSNQDSIGSLLAGFFQYYSSQGSGPQFRWTTSVLSLRSPGGVLTKDSKGWVKATTEAGGGKRVQYRYLFCIEDPFELTHNVARTVTHNGIVAIRDEFRRAHRILMGVGYGRPSQEGELYAQLIEPEVIEAVGGLKPLESTANPARWQPDHAAPQQDRQANQANASRQRVANRGQDGPRTQQPRQVTSAINLGDQDAFPSLGSASGPKKKQTEKEKEKDTSSIDGKKAQAHLEEYRRKKAEDERTKAEAEAEHTASQSAEWVLHD